ncbi:MAG: hypothetical protein ABFS02_12330, partial [Pseudomonadota bacterium]
MLRILPGYCWAVSRNLKDDYSDTNPPHLETRFAMSLFHIGGSEPNPDEPEPKWDRAAGWC